MRFQSSALAGLEPRYALFFALYPPSKPAARITRFTNRLFETHALTGRRVAPRLLHISLNSLDRHHALPERLIATACQAAAKVKTPPFVVVLNRVISFKNKDRHPRVLVGDDGVIGVAELYRLIGNALVQEGLMLRRAASFEPHMTLSREEGLQQEVFIHPVKWRVEEFCLVHSPQGESRHNILGRWQLVG